MSFYTQLKQIKQGKIQQCTFQHATHMHTHLYNLIISRNETNKTTDTDTHSSL